MLTGFTYYITMRAVKRLIHLLLFHLPLEHIKWQRKDALYKDLKVVNIETW